MCKVTFFEISNDFFLRRSHKLAPILEKVFVENFFGGIVMVEHVSIERTDFLGFNAKLHLFVVVFKFDIFGQGYIISCKYRAFVFQGFPFNTIFMFFLLPPNEFKLQNVVVSIVS